jgi:propanediol dehydratase small subunit
MILHNCAEATPRYPTRLQSAQPFGTRIARFEPSPLANEEPIMSVSSITLTSLDALQQAIQSQTTQSTSNTAQSADVLAQQSAFQAQMQQSQSRVRLYLRYDLGSQIAVIPQEFLALVKPPVIFPISAAPNRTQT